MLEEERVTAVSVLFDDGFALVHPIAVMKQTGTWDMLLHLVWLAGKPPGCCVPLSVLG